MDEYLKDGEYYYIKINQDDAPIIVQCVDGILYNKNKPIELKEDMTIMGKVPDYTSLMLVLQSLKLAKRQLNNIEELDKGLVPTDLDKLF